MKKIFNHLIKKTFKLKSNVFIALIIPGLPATKVAGKFPGPGFALTHITSASRSLSKNISSYTIKFFPENGSIHSFSWSNDKRFIDCNLRKGISNDGKNADIIVTFCIWHHVAGKLLLCKYPDEEKIASLTDFSLVVNNNVVISNSDSGMVGSLSFPSISKEGFITSIFNVDLDNRYFKKEILHLYKVTGAFRIRNTENP